MIFPKTPDRERYIFWPDRNDIMIKFEYQVKQVSKRGIVSYTPGYMILNQRWMETGPKGKVKALLKSIEGYTRMTNYEGPPISPKEDRK